MKNKHTVIRTLAVIGGVAIAAAVLIIAFTFLKNTFAPPAISAAPGSSVSNWTMTQEPVDSFEIKFPNPPSETDGSFPDSTSSSTVPYTQYVSKDVNDDYYAVNVERFPNTTDVSDGAAFLDSVVQASVKSANGTDAKTTAGTYASYPSEDYTFKSNGYYLHARAILVGREVYFVEIISGGNTFPNWDDFANTFQLTGAA